MKTGTDYSLKPQNEPSFGVLYMPKAHAFEYALSKLAAKGAEAERPWIQELAKRFGNTCL